MASPPEQYNLKWDSHQSHLFAVFETLLRTQTLVDVTLVCKGGVMMRAHKLVLSANSPFLAKIFSETPGKHPTVVFSNTPDWELQALIEFMYRGQVSVSKEQLPDLMKVADELMVRGLTVCGREHLFPATRRTIDDDSLPPSPVRPSSAPEPPDGEQCWPDNLMMASSSIKMSRMDVRTSDGEFETLNRISQGSPASSECSSHPPRRKQARPQKRREGMPSLLPAMPSNNDNAADNYHQQILLPAIKSELECDDSDDDNLSAEDNEPRDLTAMWQQSAELPSTNNGSELKAENGHGLLLDLHVNKGRPSSYPPLMTPPSSTLSLRTSMTKTGSAGPSSSSNMPMFSAPRGGPPRHWSNENLTEALRNVWSGRMKTAQASRVFGIPYNSLLMYVRGKYGKSLKLDLIRKGEVPMATGPFNARSPSLSPFLGPRLQRPTSKATTPPGNSAGLRLPANAAAAIANSPIHFSQLSLMLEEMRGNNNKPGVESLIGGNSTNKGPAVNVPPLPPFFPSDSSLRSLSMLNSLLAVPPAFNGSLAAGSLSDRFRHRSFSTDTTLVGSADD